MVFIAPSTSSFTNIIHRKIFANSRVAVLTVCLALCGTTRGFSSSSTDSCAADRMAPSIRVIPNDKLFTSEPDPQWFGNPSGSDPSWTNKNWLKSRFHFSFAEYNNYGNTNFGVLRVMNDDLVQAKRGFGTHPHRDMEIITYIVEGELTHQDSLGTKESLGRGSIQFMTAGTGVRHSEFNQGDKPLRFIQTWIVPAQRGLKPNYGSFRGGPGVCLNKMFHLISNVNDASASTPVQINQDLDGYAAEIEEGQTVLYELPKGRQAYLLCMEGSVAVNGNKLNRHDASEITGSGGVLEIKALEVESTEHGKVAHVLMFVMKSEPGSGRTDF
jgi:redox-sensitive bicupin YhaK (pirin superfamily)